MKPFDAGWEKLSPLERLAIWFGQNKKRLQGKVREYNTLMRNFCISCEDPKYFDYVNFRHDILHYSGVHQEVLEEGFFAMYNTSRALLEPRKARGSDPSRN